MAVRGYWMTQLTAYTRGAGPGPVGETNDSWDVSGKAFTTTAHTLHANASATEDGFASTSLSGSAAKRAMVMSGNESEKKSKIVQDAVAAVSAIQSSLIAAMKVHAELEPTLPGSLEKPDPSKYPTSGIGVDGAANKKKLDAANAQYAADSAAIAHAEKVAHHHVTHYDQTVQAAEPKLRPLYDDGSGDGSNGAGPVPSGTPGSVPGSRSRIAASRARIAKINPETRYQEGLGKDLIDAEKANIAHEQQLDVPEWDSKDGMWVRADGSPAPAESYALADSEEGAVPLSRTAAAVGAAFGVAGLGAAGIAMAKGGMFGPRIAAAASRVGNVSTKTTSAAKFSPSKGVNTSGSRAGASARGAASGSRGSGGGANRSGGRGTGAGGRGGKKDKKRQSASGEYIADYTDDWIDKDEDIYSDEAYQRALERKRREQQ